MSPSADRRRPERIRGDAGFTLLEVIVALGVMTTVMVALLPQLIVGIKSSATARAVTQGKGVAQGELERMRNLPFHVAPAAGEYIDVLDRYYRDLVPPATSPTCTASGEFQQPSVGWTGYVSAGSTARCSYEPSSGAFYRKVQEAPASGSGNDFMIVTDTQFLSGKTPPVVVAPRPGYDTQVNGRDNPASSQIGVSITVLYADRGTVRPISTYTQIAEHLPSSVRVQGGASVTAVHLGSVTTDNLAVSLSGGLVNITGSVSGASTVGANLAASSAGLATGEQGSGASRTVSAPPTTSESLLTAPAGALSTFGCSYACWGPSQLGPVSLSAENGLPNAGTSAAPLQATLTETTSNSGLSFGNSSNVADYRSGLRLVPPLVRLDSSAAPLPSQLVDCAVLAEGAVAASGYLRSTAVDDVSSPSTVESCAVSRTTPISLFPTEFAPRGVVRIVLDKAAARCTVQGSTHVASTSYDYRAVVEYWDGSAYVTGATVTPGMTDDPLDDVPLTTAVGGGKTLGDYIASWSAATAGNITETQTSGVAALTVPGVVSIASQPVRPATPEGLDPTSAVSLTVGALSCSAEDAR
jgi:type II secretory pathway pseudopilin PulG